jgi:S-adenosylmethionine synthetase
MVDTFGTTDIPDDRIVGWVREFFPLTPRAIIKYLDLRRPIYKETARHGHFGRTGPNFTWERIDRVDKLRRAAGISSKKAKK